MKKENTFILVVGVILGALIVLYIQAQMSLNNQQSKLAELEKTVNSNEQTVNQIVSLIQGGGQGQGQPQQAPTEGSAPGSGE